MNPFYLPSASSAESDSDESQHRQTRRSAKRKRDKRGLIVSPKPPSKNNDVLKNDENNPNELSVSHLKPQNPDSDSVKKPKLDPGSTSTGAEPLGAMINGPGVAVSNFISDTATKNMSLTVEKSKEIDNLKERLRLQNEIIQTEETLLKSTPGRDRTILNNAKEAAVTLEGELITAEAQKKQILMKGVDNKERIEGVANVSEPMNTRIMEDAFLRIRKDRVRPFAGVAIATARLHEREVYVHFSDQTFALANMYDELTPDEQKAALMVAGGINDLRGNSFKWSEHPEYYIKAFCTESFLGAVEAAFHYLTTVWKVDLTLTELLTEHPHAFGKFVGTNIIRDRVTNPESWKSETQTAVSVGRFSFLNGENMRYFQKYIRNKRSNYTGYFSAV